MRRLSHAADDFEVVDRLERAPILAAGGGATGRRASGVRTRLRGDDVGGGQLRGQAARPSPAAEPGRESQPTARKVAMPTSAHSRPATPRPPWRSLGSRTGRATGQRPPARTRDDRRVLPGPHPRRLPGRRSRRGADRGDRGRPGGGDPFPLGRGLSGAGAGGGPAVVLGCYVDAARPFGASCGRAPGARRRRRRGTGRGRRIAKKCIEEGDGSEDDEPRTVAGDGDRVRPGTRGGDARGSRGCLRGRGTLEGTRGRSRTRGRSAGWWSAYRRSSTPTPAPRVGASSAAQSRMSSRTHRPCAGAGDCSWSRPPRTESSAQPTRPQPTETWAGHRPRIRDTKPGRRTQGQFREPVPWLIVWGPDRRLTLAQQGLRRLVLGDRALVTRVGEVAVAARESWSCASRWTLQGRPDPSREPRMDRPAPGSALMWRWMREGNCTWAAAHRYVPTIARIRRMRMPAGSPYAGPGR